MEIYDLYPETEYDNSCEYCDTPTDNENYCDSCLKQSHDER